MTSALAAYVRCMLVVMLLSVIFMASAAESSPIEISGASPSPVYMRLVKLKGQHRSLIHYTNWLERQIRYWRRKAQSSSGETAQEPSTLEGQGLGHSLGNTSTSPQGSHWDLVADCEASGDWSANTGNGFYGGLQFTLSTWYSYGGSGLPSDASRETQIAVAERVLAGQGPEAWPNCYQ